MILYAIIAVLITALRDALVISNGISIDHRGWKKWLIMSIVHIVFFVITGLNWWYWLMAFLIQVAFFDIFLNYIRGLPWDYMEPMDKTDQKSWWGQVWNGRLLLLNIVRLISIVGAIVLQIKLL